MALFLPVIAAALGAGGMYLYDPAQGRRRRAELRDRARSKAQEARDFADAAQRDLAQRAKGITTAGSRILSSPPATDEKLVARVRSRLGRASSHPAAIKVSVSEATARLEGHVLSDEHAQVVLAVRMTPGIRGVDDALVVPENPETVSALQGGRRRRGPMPELLRDEWSPGTRALAGGAGVVLVLYSMRHPGIVGLAAAAAGIGTLLRAGLNRPVHEIRGMVQDATTRVRGAASATAQLPARTPDISDVPAASGGV